MLFTTSNSVQAPGLGVMANTSPSVIGQDGALYLFYTGNGSNGIFCAKSADAQGQTWNAVGSIGPGGVGILSGTSPNAILFNGLIYVFYSGCGLDGAWYTTWNGSNWQPIVSIKKFAPSMSLLAGTSPTAVVFREALYLFFVGSGGGGLFQVKTVDGNNWSSSTQVVSGRANVPLNIAAGSSAGVAVFDDRIHLFFNDAGGRGILCVTSEDGNIWSSELPVSGRSSVYQNASPSACVAYNNKLNLVWAGGATGTEMFLTYSDNGIRWADAEQQLPQVLSSDAIVAGTSPCLMEYNNALYLFWTNQAPDVSAGISFSSAAE